MSEYKYTGLHTSKEKENEDRAHHNRQMLIARHMKRRDGKAVRIIKDKNGYYRLVSWYEDGYEKGF